MPIQIANRLKILDNRQESKIYHPKSRTLLPAFSLIEVLLSIFIIVALAAILLIATSSLTLTHRSNLQTVASKIASKKIEDLRNTPFVSLPSSGPFSDPNLSKLPQSTANLTITNYQGSNQIKQVTINISWVVKGLTQQTNIDTLIYQNGI